MTTKFSNVRTRDLSSTQNFKYFDFDRFFTICYAHFFVMKENNLREKNGESAHLFRFPRGVGWGGGVNPFTHKLLFIDHYCYLGQRSVEVSN